MSQKQSLADYVRESIDNIEDIDIFQDSKTKKEFIDELVKNSDFPRESIRLTFSTQLKSRIKTDGKNTNDFTKKQTKRFSSKLDIKPDTKKVEVGKDNQSLDKSLEDKKSMPKLKNPKTTGEEFTIDNKTYESFGVAVDSIIGAFIDNMDEMTQMERESFGACLKLGFGDVIESEGNVRRLFGLVGILGIYTRRIKEARKITKEKKSKLKLEDKEKPYELNKQTKQFKPTKKEVDKFNKNNDDYFKGLEDDV